LNLFQKLIFDQQRAAPLKVPPGARDPSPPLATPLLVVSISHRRTCSILFGIRLFSFFGLMVLFCSFYHQNNRSPQVRYFLATTIGRRPFGAELFWRRGVLALGCFGTSAETDK